MPCKLTLHSLALFLRLNDPDAGKARREPLAGLSEEKAEVHGLADLPLFMCHAVSVHA